MTVVTITAASVVPSTGAVTIQGTALEAVTAGQAVYRDTTTGKFGLHDANGATAIIRELLGVAINSAGANQPLVVQTSGLLTIGGTVVANTVYIGGANPGSIHPIADITGGWYLSIIGAATTTGILKLGVLNTGVAS